MIWPDETLQIYFRRMGPYDVPTYPLVAPNSSALDFFAGAHDYGCRHPPFIGTQRLTEFDMELEKWFWVGL